MINHIQNDGLWDSTMIIITAKHGQSPIDPTLYSSYLKVGSSPATVLDNAGLIPFSEAPSNPTGIGPTEDDVSLIWLKNPSETAKAVGILKTNASELGLGQYYYGPSLAMNYDVPGLEPNDPRTPDIIVTPNVGITYSGSSKKHAEHGGFAHDDTNVVLLVSSPTSEAKTVYTSVGTNQVAPTILQSLGIDPQLLDGVRLEGTEALPR
jgi:arylsulfatase A-like enzyme